MKQKTLLIFVAGLYLLAILTACGSSSLSTPTPEEPTPIIRLFYYGQTPPYADSHKIYSATSVDGLTFTEESGARFEYEGITDPDVFFDGTQYVMFSSLVSTVIKATSTTANGTYVEDSSFEWDNGGVFSTVKISDVYKTFYAAVGVQGISVASYDSSSGQLTAEGVALENPHDVGSIGDPSVIQLADETWLMFYKYYPSPESGPDEHQIYTATSPDGSIWTATMNLVRDQASVPGAVCIDNTIYVYFVDGTLTDTNLGVGVSEDDGATFTFSEVSFENSVESEHVDPVAIAY